MGHRRAWLIHSAAEPHSVRVYHPPLHSHSTPPGRSLFQELRNRVTWFLSVPRSTYTGEPMGGSSTGSETNDGSSERGFPSSSSRSTLEGAVCSFTAAVLASSAKTAPASSSGAHQWLSSTGHCTGPLLTALRTTHCSGPRTLRWVWFFSGPVHKPQPKNSISL